MNINDIRTSTNNDECKTMHSPTPMCSMNSRARDTPTMDIKEEEEEKWRKKFIIEKNMNENNKLLFNALCNV